MSTNDIWPAGDSPTCRKTVLGITAIGSILGWLGYKIARMGCKEWMDGPPWTG